MDIQKSLELLIKKDKLDVKVYCIIVKYVSADSFMKSMLRIDEEDHVSH